MVIDLSGNPMLCDCTDDSYQTIQMIQNAEDFNVVFFGKYQYECIYGNIPNQLLMDINSNEVKSNCQPNYYKLIAFISVSFAVLLFLVISLRYLHKYRYHIYTCYYRCRQNKQNNHVNRKYKFDAFISILCRRSILGA